jgi:hypothetical protein
MRRAAWLTVLIVALAAGTALAGGRRRSERVRKGVPVEQMHIYWASMMSATELSVSRFPGHSTVGDEFEIVDQMGYVGRARVHAVERVQTCPGITYDNATATLVTSAQPTPSYTTSVALPVSKRDLSRARVMYGDEVADPPPRGQIDVAIDFDGDGRADIARLSYECAAPGGQTGMYASCFDIIARDRDKTDWKVIETISWPQCY